ncbi:MAG: hypothetical protein A2X05_18535 [Bacteroidetes bacterium GWE2_41_25]|nr:MAG: hypothetical protein A2X05_18535 [Bacteroidetes bacterium GWE2_41_25]OFX97725.1 MAG: hypothetical protein A2X06_13330 [Bacteroidetes bacterium GWC2_40_22]OFY58414.1 MAG: hypothetical protein A2X04_06750 [Bacteroidetes bacterium GWF2_41_9]HAM10142.1 hypothetical protein [Bacteroidales bacterium]
MKTIDDIMRGTRDIWDDREPEAGHFERFSVKLELRRQARTVKRSIVPYLLRAAVVTLLVTLSSLWTWDHFIRPENSRMRLGEVSPQYREVENYYIHQVSLLQDEIVNTEIQSNPEQKQILISELKSMDSVYVSLQKELKANPDDERIISAMIEHYQTKLEVMTYIVDQLQTIRNNNTSNEDHEKVSL